MIPLLIELAIAAAVLLFVASLGFWNDTGRSLRHAALALFFGAPPSTSGARASSSRR